MGWKYARFEKYRYSCNSAALYESNASDAAYLHRDLIPVDDDMVEAYTLVYYADVAQLRIVAGSEHERTLSVRRVWEGVTVKEFGPGDAILFNGHMLHGACNTRGSRRRVLQIFGICPNPDDVGKILSIKDGDVAPRLERVVASAMTLFANNKLLRAAQEYTVANNYFASGARLPHGFRCISAEAARLRIRHGATHEPQSWNLYAPVNTNYASEGDTLRIRWIVQYRSYLITVLLLSAPVQLLLLAFVLL